MNWRLPSCNRKVQLGYLIQYFAYYTIKTVVLFCTRNAACRPILIKTKIKKRYNIEYRASRCDFISSHIIPSFHFISYHIISFHFISFHFISYHIISFNIISFHFISYHFISYHLISFHFISYHFI